MVVAVSLVMKKNSGTQHSVHASLLVIENCVSVDAAIGAAVVRALEKEPDHTIASVCASEVGGLPAANEEGAEERVGSGWTGIDELVTKVDVEGAVAKYGDRWLLHADEFKRVKPDNKVADMYKLPTVSEEMQKEIADAHRTRAQDFSGGLAQSKATMRKLMPYD